MSSIVKSVFQATVGLLIKKGRDLAAEKLREGDVGDERFRSLIVREIDDIKSKLDGIALKDLLASVSFFKEGLVLFYDMFDEITGGKKTEGGAARKNEEFSLKSSTDVIDGVKTELIFPRELEKIQMSQIDESATRWLSSAKKRFEDARRNATVAFNDKALHTLDRILAMQYRVMATILEAADNPREALSPCTLCLEELHSMPAVQKNFKAALKALKGRLFPLPSLARNADQRGKIISTVVYINKVVYDVKQMLGKPSELLFWPCVDTGEEQVDPLRDARVAEILRKQDMVHSFVPSSLGRAGAREQRVSLPRSIASTTQGHYIVGDIGDRNVKAFDRSGKYLYSLECPGTDEHGSRNVVDVATDQEANVYVLVSRRNESEVYVFNRDGQYQRQFELNNGFRCHKVTVEDSMVLVLVVEKEAGLPIATSSGKANQTWIQVYDTNGVLVESFPDKCQRPCDLIATKHGSVMVLDNLSSCINVFSTKGKRLHQFEVISFPEAIAFHEDSQQVIVASVNSKKRLHLSIYSQAGKFRRSVELDVEEEEYSIKGLAVNKEGRISVVDGKTILAI